MEGGSGETGLDFFDLATARDQPGNEERPRRPYEAATPRTDNHAPKNQGSRRSSAVAAALWRVTKRPAAQQNTQRDRKEQHSNFRTPGGVEAVYEKQKRPMSSHG